MSTQITFTISQLAEEFGITTRTIRFYEEKGLLSPARSGQQRQFSSADKVRLGLILRGKRIGLTLQESSDIIDMYDPEHGNVEQLQRLLDRISERRTILRQQMLDLKTVIKELDDVQLRCEKALHSALKEEAQA